MRGITYWHFHVEHSTTQVSQREERELDTRNPILTMYWLHTHTPVWNDRRHWSDFSVQLSSHFEIGYFPQGEPAKSWDRFYSLSSTTEESNFRTGKISHSLDCALHSPCPSYTQWDVTPLNPQNWEDWGPWQLASLQRTSLEDFLLPIWQWKGWTS